jgi:hypothetical protein
MMMFPERLPECLASERVKIGERWEIIDRKGVEYGGGFASKDEAKRFQTAVGVLLEDARIVHVTRYRRRV